MVDGGSVPVAINQQKRVETARQLSPLPRTASSVNLLDAACCQCDGVALLRVNACARFGFQKCRMIVVLCALGPSKTVKAASRSVEQQDSPRDYTNIVLVLLT